jgi:hypothetical protein
MARHAIRATRRKGLPMLYKPVDKDGIAWIGIDTKARVSQSTSGKSAIVARIQRPETIPGTNVSLTLVAWVSKADAQKEGSWDKLPVPEKRETSAA